MRLRRLKTFRPRALPRRKTAGRGVVANIAAGGLLVGHTGAARVVAPMGATGPPAGPGVVAWCAGSCVIAGAFSFAGADSPFVADFSKAEPKGPAFSFARLAMLGWRGRRMGRS